MEQQVLFNIYFYVGVTVIAQSIIAWELGTKGWDIVLPKNCLKPRVIVAILLFVGQVIWQRLGGLQFPIQSVKEAWPVLIPIGFFLYAKMRQRILANQIPRLNYFLRAKDLYYTYTRRIGLPFEKMTEDHFIKARKDSLLREAEELYKKAIELSLHEGENRDAGIVKYQLGMLYNIQGNKSDAMRAFNEATNILNEYPDDEESVGSLSGCYYNLGLLAEREEELAKAREYFKKAYDLETSIEEVRDAYASKMALERCGGTV